MRGFSRLLVCVGLAVLGVAPAVHAEVTPVIPSFVDFATYATPLTTAITAMLAICLGWYFGGALVRKGVSFITGGLRKI